MSRKKNRETFTVSRLNWFLLTCNREELVKMAQYWTMWMKKEGQRPSAVKSNKIKFCTFENAQKTKATMISCRLTASSIPAKASWLRGSYSPNSSMELSLNLSKRVKRGQQRIKATRLSNNSQIVKETLLTTQQWISNILSLREEEFG